MGTFVLWSSHKCQAIFRRGVCEERLMKAAGRRLSRRQRTPTITQSFDNCGTSGGRNNVPGKSKIRSRHWNLARRERSASRKILPGPNAQRARRRGHAGLVLADADNAVAEADTSEDLHVLLIATSPFIRRGPEYPRRRWGPPAFSGWWQCAHHNLAPSISPRATEYLLQSPPPWVQ
jgi:hypothetical protein